MAMKEWFRRLQPAQLYLMLTLTVAFFMTELVVSHVTHALTLLVDSYHMLCNIIALSGCIITIKYGRDGSPDKQSSDFKGSVSTCVEEELTSKMSYDPAGVVAQRNAASSSVKEKHLKNTFGWARIDVIVMLICCVFLASLCFSVLVEALQTLIHIDHHDEMHHPFPVLCIGLMGLILNGVCYLLIGGYTFHQGSFLYVTENGDVVLDKIVTNDSVKRGERRLSRTRPIPTQHTTYNNRQGPREMLRDVLGCIFVIIASLVGCFSESSLVVFVDPTLSIVSSLMLLWLSYPYMKESGLILLQTMPDTINIDCLKTELIQAFPDILNVHDLHIWQLTVTKIISTCHITFQDPKVYANIRKEVTEFFISQGITQVTVQPEFSSNKIRNSIADSVQGSIADCLMKCQGKECTSRHCCNVLELDSLDGEKRSRSSKNGSIRMKSMPNLESIHVDVPTDRSGPKPDPIDPTAENPDYEEQTRTEREEDKSNMQRTISLYDLRHHEGRFGSNKLSKSMSCEDMTSERRSEDGRNRNIVDGDETRPQIDENVEENVEENIEEDPTKQTC